MTETIGRVSRPGHGGVCDRLVPVLERFARGPLPVRLRAWDGSEAGPDGAPVVVLRTPRALRRVLWHPGELGVAQAYVTGELDIEGDVSDLLRLAWTTARDRHLSGPPGPRARGLGLQGLGSAAATAARLGLLGPPLPAPATQARVRGWTHSRGRDRSVIAHHYDLTADFYRLLLDPAMAYSCARWESGAAGYTLAEAQWAKLDSICRKLGLADGQAGKPGQTGKTLLDLGCGWGSLTLHAASQYGARVDAVTLSAEQAAFVRERVRSSDLAEVATVQETDYRDVDGRHYDAIATIEMGEHVGARQYPAFCARLRRLLAADGRLLIQQMSRDGRAPGGGPFIESYIAPDMHMRPVGETVALLERAGLEVAHVEGMRRDYGRTIRAWLDNFERHEDEITRLIGAEQVRVWRLYLHGGALAFEEGRMGVHQIVAVRREG
ncbi:MAG TPA: cyclopropane-fatty-acyl-phospholipid synthase family protein [Streptosporangiaceae bacterium]|jgi:cyclopropane-fatty-acyl-phospholipid synthase|nr:cyclopropane-fatty-acyl-phospholipid synthase family protein [Streptosporangiaceae bacterium]